MLLKEPVEKKVIQELARTAKDLGFIAVGFVPASRPLFYEQFAKWIRGEKYGHMEWLKRSMELRADPERVLKGCRTIICLAYPYSSSVPCTPDGLKASRYTEGLSVDYHVRVKQKAAPLVGIIARGFPGSRSRVCVDSAPLLERSLAYGAGVGFFGKNNMLIIPGYGSYFYLAEILTTADLKINSQPLVEQKCGDCNKCLESCPTGALERAFLSDSKKCLSYLTIEYKGSITRHMAPKMNNFFFGCDICQEVCPFNRKESPLSSILPSSEDILEMDEEAFKQLFGNTAFERAGLMKIKSNLRAASDKF